MVNVEILQIAISADKLTFTENERITWDYLTTKPREASNKKNDSGKHIVDANKMIESATLPKFLNKVIKT